MLKTTSLEMRDSILKLEELKKKLVNFTVMSAPIRNIMYVIINAPFQIPEFYFQETYGFVDVKIIIKGKEKTQSVVFTSTKTPSMKITVPLSKTTFIQRYVPEPEQCFRCHRWKHTIKAGPTRGVTTIRNKA